MIILYVSIFLFVLYSILIFYYLRAWQSIPEYVPSVHTGKGKISIIVPARNEDANILSCLTSVCNQDYANELLQVVVVDDSSTDRTWELIKAFKGDAELCPVRLAPVSDANFSAHKKRAIATGVTLARNDLIVTTDADCNHPQQWIRTMAAFHQDHGSAFIVAPVVFENNTSILEVFQALDFMVLQGITAAAVFKRFHSMCNGANLAYEKEAFFAVNGFEGVDNVASGDDMFLMHKIWKKYPGRVHYLKSRLAIVSTKPMTSWKGFFNQRLRWASKVRFYKERRIVLVGLVVYLFNLSFLMLLVGGFWRPILWLYVLVLWLAKTAIEFPFVYSVATFFEKKRLLKYFFFFQPLHVGYTILAGWLGQFGKYEWKGRKVR